MELTKSQNKELDSLKDSILMIERNINNAQTELEIAFDCEDDKKVSKIEKAIDFGTKEIYRIVKTQSESMKLEFNLVMDLIFYRKETLEFLNK